MGNEGKAPHIRNLGTRRVPLLSFTFAAVSLLREEPPVPTVREGGLNNRPEANRRVKNFLCLSAIKLRFPGMGDSQVSILTEPRRCTR
jgi:hypothetical protein